MDSIRIYPASLMSDARSLKYPSPSLSSSDAYFSVAASTAHAALYFLYSGTGRTRDSLAENREYMLFTAVPSDADAVLKCRDFSTMLSCLVSDGSSVSYFVTGRKDPGKFAAFLRNVSDSSSLYSSLMASPAVVSIHNIGVLTPLLVIDADRSGEPESSAVKLMLDNAAKAGMTAVYSDAADYAPAGSPLRKRSLLLVSPSDVLVDAALRHLKAEVSVLDLPGFPEAVSGISSDNILVLPSGGVRRIASEIFSSKCSEESASAAGFAECTAFSIDRNSSDGFTLSGNSYSDGSLSNIMEIYSGISPASSEVSSVLPSYAISAVSVPMADVEAYLEAYLKYAQTKSLVKEIEAGRAAMVLAASAEVRALPESVDVPRIVAMVRPRLVEGELRSADRTAELPPARQTEACALLVAAEEPFGLDELRKPVVYDLSRVFVYMHLKLRLEPCSAWPRIS